ncbi:glycosyltransferase [Variovorax boronicumulans]|uniref:glycosyltransferase n=1 Tax=Variovorax boronicumulans TaxID=436515 RepID=UPI0027806DA0|nr:glycosyltransferase [Variovorax boronicumulans]MDQ0042402.1 undecaprenyl-phosphate 4-deoxy-4-formamido-L-arabinose transferase [Variovorax boronicumulans]
MNMSQRISIVVPVYAGERTLPVLMAEIEKLTELQTTAGGNSFVVCEVLLVHDCGHDRSDLTISALAEQYAFVQPIWLSRNYGQHAATMAGMASATGDWVVTMDEDGQQDPQSIGAMLDLAQRDALQLVYAQPTNLPPHGWVRNFFSRSAKAISTRLLGNRAIGSFNSFRLIDGEIARTLSAYCGNGVYLDVGLFWITGRVGHCPLRVREELGRPSGYSFLALVKHFWRLVLTTGTRPLRLITILGFFSVLLAMGFAVYAVYEKYTGQVPVEGWTSLAVVVAFFSGVILMALGVIAEYLAVTMGIVMGKPLYVVSSKPTRPTRRP